MKKDNFISVGIVLTDDNVASKIKYLQQKIFDTYNYFEIILLNNKVDILVYTGLLKSTSNIRIVELSSFVDIEVAHTALIENCIGDYCAIIDLSHDSIDDLFKMLVKAETYDVVVGKREKKMQSFIELLTSKIFYRTISLFTSIKINSMYSDFFIINRKVINFITKNEDKIKFLKLLTFNNGFNKYEYTYMPIGKKSSKRTFFENVNFTIDILVNNSCRLIRMGTLLSISASIANLFYMLYIFGVYIFKENIAQGWASSNMYSSAMYFVIFLVLAIIGEYVRVILHNQKQTPLYEIIDEKNSLALFPDKKNIDKE